MADVPQLAVEAGVALRRVRDTDRPFLEELHRSLRWDEFAATGWSDAAKTAFLASQFDLQQRSYAGAFPQADVWIIECERAPIGQVRVDRSTAMHHLIDISLAPEWRGRGIGGTLIAALRDAVHAGHAERVSLNVDRTNPAAYRLYKRLGFVETPPSTPYPGLSIEMVWPAPIARPGSEAIR